VLAEYPGKMDRVHTDLIGNVRDAYWSALPSCQRHDLAEPTGRSDCAIIGVRHTAELRQQQVQRLLTGKRSTSTRVADRSQGVGKRPVGVAPLPLSLCHTFDVRAYEAENDRPRAAEPILVHDARRFDDYRAKRALVRCSSHALQQRTPKQHADRGAIVRVRRLPVVWRIGLQPRGELGAVEKV
jgi:hypothetical protein